MGKFPQGCADYVCLPRAIVFRPFRSQLRIELFSLILRANLLRTFSPRLMIYESLILYNLHRARGAAIRLAADL